MSQRKVRWGVLGVAKIAMEKVIPAMQRGQFSEIVGIASRSREKATTAAQSLGLAKAYETYESLLEDPQIDAVYNPLPNHLHVPLSIKALEAGKHVLCEKPIALTAREGQLLVDAAAKFPKLKLMEAFMYRHHPQWVTAKRMIQGGMIGTLRTIQSFFSYYNVDPNNIRNISTLGGGGLMDIGCYPVSLSRFLFEREPARVFGLSEYDPQFATDRIASAILDFGEGSSTFTCSTQLSPFQRVNIFGTEGRIEIEIPFNAPPDRPCKMWYSSTLTGTAEITIPASDQYTVQGNVMSQAILNDTPVPTPIKDAVANMHIIEGIAAAGKIGKWVRPAAGDARS